MNQLVHQLGYRYSIDYDDYTYVSIWIKNADYYEDYEGTIWVYSI